MLGVALLLEALIGVAHWFTLIGNFVRKYWFAYSSSRLVAIFGLDGWNEIRFGYPVVLVRWGRRLGVVALLYNTEPWIAFNWDPSAPDRRVADSWVTVCLRRCARFFIGETSSAETSSWSYDLPFKNFTELFWMLRNGVSTFWACWAGVTGSALSCTAEASYCLLLAWMKPARLSGKVNAFSRISTAAVLAAIVVIEAPLDDSCARTSDTPTTDMSANSVASFEQYPLPCTMTDKDSCNSATSLPMSSAFWIRSTMRAVSDNCRWTNDNNSVCGFAISCSETLLPQAVSRAARILSPNSDVNSTRFWTDMFCPVSQSRLIHFSFRSVRKIRRVSVSVQDLQAKGLWAVAVLQFWLHCSPKSATT